MDHVLAENIDLFGGDHADGENGGNNKFRAQRRRMNPIMDLDADMGDGFSQGYGLAHNAARDDGVSVISGLSVV